MGRLLLPLAVSFMICGSVAAQVIVDDNFDSYADDAAFNAVWRSDFGDGNNALPGVDVGLLVPRTTGPFPPPPFDGSGDPSTLPPVDPIPAGEQAVAFNDQGFINEWDNDGDHSNVPFSILPSPTQAVRLSADIFDFVNGNRRFSVGLRSDQAPANLLELGFWNSDTFDPVDPNNAPPNDPVLDQPTTAYAYRLALWGPIGGELVREPNWQYFDLPIEFDDPDIDHNGDGRFGNGDGLVTPVDVGPGWHRYSATVTETDVTFEMDLFRDGSTDASVTWEIETTGDPFTSLRMGGPSGVSMNEFTMADNVKLELVDIVSSINGDFDNNGFYECNDVDMLVSAIVDVKNGAMPDLNFDLTQDGNVADDDLEAWRAEAGAGVAAPALTASGNPVLKGDADLDGTVDGLDFIKWNNNKFTSLAEWCGGDFDADGTVDGLDFIIWNDNKFMSADQVAVPEPGSSLVFLAVAFLALARRARKA